MNYSLMAVFAHPDDEAFGTGGTISRYASEGVKVTLVCTTRGEAGEISDANIATPETLGQVREGELRCAAETMGVAEVIFLGYRDSGMANTPENENPLAYIQAPDAEVVRKLVILIRRVRPDVIVTFEPNGGYGHPDHKAVQRHTFAAFHAASSPDHFPELGDPWSTPRLFYTAIPRPFFEDLRRQMAELGISREGLEWMDDPNNGWPDDEVNIELDVTSSVEAKWEALNCHRTQFGPGNLFRRLPEAHVKKLMSKEHFAIAWPEELCDRRLSGLFDGLN
jgi:LmbE family N-acetylglucosaminyl deacetylase